MADASLDEELLRALRSGPDRSLGGLVEEHGGVYRLSERGRRTLAERALDAQP